MLKDAHEYNDRVLPSDFEIERLRKLLPEYFDKGGNFMVDRLQETLQSRDIAVTREGYELKFLGKSYAKYLTSAKTETLVVPDLEFNDQPKNQDSKNLYVVGDNLDALKHLLGSYGGSVKCIYIDPPYNTGSDGFVYKDDFGFTEEQLKEKIGATDQEAKRILDLQGKSSHSAWLTFMYPRLQLAKQLLDGDGIIFISIDDNEQANLKLLCDEVFGEQNFVENYIWESSFRPDNSSRVERENAQHVLCYARDKTALPDLVGAQKTTEGLPSLTKASMKPTTLEFQPSWVDFFIDDGEYKAGERASGYVLENDLIVRDGKAQQPFKLSGRVIWSQSYLEEQIQQGTRIVIKSEGLVPYSNKRKTSALAPTTLIPRGNVGDVLAANSEVTSLFGSRVFTHPKPSSLIKYLLNTVVPSDSEALVLDFFSGSATTADAVMQLNAEDRGNRRYILVQLAEDIMPGTSASKDGYKTIDEIGRERIKRAAVKIEEETGADIDYGFKLFRLEEATEETFDQLIDFDPDQGNLLFAGDYVSKFDFSGTPGRVNILATWLLEDGYGLTAKPQKVKLADYELDVCGDSAYIIEPGLAGEDVIELVKKIEHKKLDIGRLVIFGYSIEFSVLHELRNNLGVLKSRPRDGIKIIERF